MDAINFTHDIFYYFPFPRCVILSYLQHISSLNLQIWKSNYKRMNSNKTGCAEKDIFRHAKGYRSRNFSNPYSGNASKENYQSCLCQMQKRFHPGHLFVNGFLFSLLGQQMFSKQTKSNSLESVSLPDMYLCDLSCLGGLCLMFSLIQRDLNRLCTLVLRDQTLTIQSMLTFRREEFFKRPL